jgi:hypothetical protein
MIDAVELNFRTPKWCYKDDSIVITISKLLDESGVTEPCGMIVDKVVLHGRIVRQDDVDREWIIPKHNT